MPLPRTLSWTGDSLRLLDQTRLPEQTVYVELHDEKQVHDAIKRLVVRGAPAIGVAGAFGAYLGVRGATDEAPAHFFQRLDQVCNYLKSTRPTAVNLAWALERVRRAARDVCGTQHSSPTCCVVRDVQDAILSECLTMLEDDERCCLSIGEHGLKLLRDLRPRSADGTLKLLTHCNAGSLATVAYGTALAPIYLAHEQGMKVHVFVDETRPLLQGSRITAYELQQAGVPLTVICDNMAATVMSRGEVDAVIVGADRIAANGDVANKVGTLAVAIVAKHFGVPFFVAAPISTVDPACPGGACIPIEQRAAEEITCGFGNRTAPLGVNVYNPAFDVTPCALVTAIVTEEGILRPPYDLSGQHSRNRMQKSSQKSDVAPLR